MSKSVYKDRFDEILKMKANGKTNAEIVKILNKKYHRGANVNALKTFLKRNNGKKNEKKQTDTTKTVPENQEGVQKKEEPKKEEIKKDLPKKSKAPVLDTAPLKDVHKDFVNTLQGYREDREIFSIINDEFGANIEKLMKVPKHKHRYFLFTGVWLLTVLFSGFGGFYLGRTFQRTAILYAINMIGIPGGILIGLAISIAILYKTKIGEQVNKAIAAGMFIIFSVVIAVLLTIYIPGKTGVYVGTGLVGLTFLCLLFPKKKGK